MGSLDGRVIIVTGAGRGVGREHALLLAAEGARVVVNDLGGEQSGEGADLTPAMEVVETIRAAGGEAVVNGDTVATWDGAKTIVQTALDQFGELHAVVNNAGILRDRMLVNMTEDEFDSVVAVHQKGTFLMMRHAAEYWRGRAKAEDAVKASIVNTTSTSGLHSNPGQTNYAAAKSAIATMSIVAAQELWRYGVRVNAIAPSARTRMTLSTPGLAERIAAPEGDEFDKWHPRHISPLVAWLCTEDCPATAQVYWVGGRQVSRYLEWTAVDEAETESDWTVDSIGEIVGGWQTEHVVTRGS
jgi:NAD(P)-dependent dehydrogenase (short-subunit alcohol dehydrogenase family)